METTGETWVNYISRTKTMNGKNFQMKKQWHTSELLLKSFKTWAGQSSAKGVMNTLQSNK